MTDKNETLIKRNLIKACQEYIGLRIATARIAMNDSQLSANEEGKSSAGDKYETGRAMMQIERDQAANQLVEALKLKSVIDQLQPNIQHEIVSLGSVALTTAFNVFIAIGAGKIRVGEDDFLVVGKQSPLGKELLGKKAKEQFIFNGQPNTIIEIF